EPQPAPSHSTAEPSASTEEPSTSTAEPSTSTAEPSASHAPLDKTKFPELRDGIKNHKKLEHLGDEFEIMSGEDPNFNCIAHAVGVKDAIIDVPGNGLPWNRFEDADSLFQSAGFVRLEGDHLDFSKVPGREKVVLYARKNKDGDIRKFTHAAFQ